MAGICDGKIALLSGEAGRIGRASAVVLACAGARLMVTDVADCGAAHNLTVNVADEREVEPMGPVAKSKQITSAVVCLSSDGASLMTGHALPVDGGYGPS